MVARLITGAFPVFSYRSLRHRDFSAHAAGQGRYRAFKSSSACPITAPARSRSFCSFRAFPRTVKSRSRIVKPLMMSRTAPPSDRRSYSGGPCRLLHQGESLLRSGVSGVHGVKGSRPFL